MFNKGSLDSVTYFQRNFPRFPILEFKFKMISVLILMERKLMKSTSLVVFTNEALSDCHPPVACIIKLL
jgi:hypothetical protein